MSCLQGYDGMTLDRVEITAVNVDELASRINKIKSTYLNSGAGISEVNQRYLKNELEEIKVLYNSLKNIKRVADYEKGVFVIPPKAEVKTTVKSYCLNPYRAGPKAGEPYILSAQEPDIAMYREIMTYTNTKEIINGIDKQVLIWNIVNKVRFEDLTVDQMALLTRIDAAAYLRLNSYLKEAAGRMIMNLVPGLWKAYEIHSLVEGKIYDYKQYENVINALVSAEKMPFVCGPVKADGYELYTVIETRSFFELTITFINVTNKPITVAGYLKPFRKDVQALGLDLPFVIVGGLEVIVTDEIIERIRIAFDEIEKLII